MNPNTVRAVQDKPELTCVFRDACGLTKPVPGPTEWQGFQREKKKRKKKEGQSRQSQLTKGHKWVVRSLEGSRMIQGLEGMQ